MFKIFLAWLFLLVQVCTPAYATVTRTIAADQIRGMESVKNYITNAYGEKSTKGWTVSKNTVAAASPDSGFVTTGLSNSFAVSATTPITGDKSFLFTLAAQGDQVCTPITLDSGHKYKVIQGSIDYAVASGTFADDAASVWIYDVTNTTWIQPAPYLLKNHSLPSETLPFEFQATSSTSYKVCIHQAAASTAALRIDNVFVGKRAKAYGSPVTDFKEITGFTSTWDAYTSSVGTTVYGRRVGDTLEADIELEITGATSGALTVTLPTAYTIDTNKLKLSSNASVTIVGYGHIRDAGTASLTAAALYASSTTLTITYLDPSSGTKIATTGMSATTPITWANGDSIRVRIAVPILGWSSSTVMSNDADTRVVAAVYEISGSTANSSVADAATEILDYDTKIIDTHNAVTTGASWKFTAPVPGLYRVSANMLWANVTNLSSSSFYLYKEGAQYAYWGLRTSAANYDSSGSSIVYLTAGQYIDVRAYQDDSTSATRSISAVANRYQVSIERISGPAQIAASETVSATINQSANITNIAPSNSYFKINFNQRVHDTHSAWDTAAYRYNAPTAGKYAVSASLLIISTNVLANNYELYVYKNGASVRPVARAYPHAISIPFCLSGSTTLDLIAGDYIEIYIYGAGNNSVNQLTSVASSVSINRIGL